MSLLVGDGSLYIGLLRDRDYLISRLEQFKEDLSSKEQKYKDKIDELKSTISQILLTSKEKIKRHLTSIIEVSISL